MSLSEKKMFTHNLLTSDSTILPQLTKLFSTNIEYSGAKGNLSAFIVTIFLILILIKTIQARRKPKQGYISYADTLPYMQWIPFVKLPILDAIILWYKVRKEGVKVTEKVFLQCGPDSAVNLGFKTVLTISDPNTVQQVLSSTSKGHLSKAKLVYDHMFTRLMKDGLIASKVDSWSAHRKIISPAFKYKSLVTYHKYICDGAKELVQSACNVAAETGNGLLCNKIMKEIIEVNAVKIITHIIMGSESVNLSDEKRSLFHESFKIGFKLTLDRFYRPELWIPPFCWLHSKRQMLEQSIDTITEITSEITENYRKKLEGEKRKCKVEENSKHDSAEKYEDENIGIKPVECLVEMMIKSGLTNKEISDEIATFLIAGHETVKAALDLLIFQLARNKQHQEKCQTEVDELFNTKLEKDNSHLDMEDFSKLKYLEMCILESLRLTPTIPAILRELQEPLKVDDKTIMPAGQYVVVVIWLLHRNPSIYPNPEIYDPSRFLAENVKRRHPFSFIPFSMGMRNCIGWKVGLLELKVIMAWLLRYFEMDTTDEPDDVKLIFGTTIVPERPYNVTFKKRV